MPSTADPDAPGLPGAELRETHISWVALTGDRAYKVKKPVVLPFLDYGTVERRRALCEEEVRVNRRLAPDVYLGVVDVPWRGGTEPAVEMRRYDEARTLQAVLDAGVVPSEAVLERVGARLAAFHATAGRVGADAAVAGLRGVVDETLATLAGCGADPAAGAWAARWFEPLAGELRDRAGRGLAVDGHGDLRAEHVLLTDPVTVVDAVEFDPALRAADAGYDLAFLLMDLSRADPSGALARAVLRGYRDAGGDPGPDRLLAFWCGLRALVRAKVDLLRAAQLDGEAAAARRRRAGELLTLAGRFAWGVRLPQRVVCVAGVAASGKSTVAAALAAASGRAPLGSDTARKAAAGVAASERLPDAAYAAGARAAVYRALGEAVAAAEGPVVVDATFVERPCVVAFVEAAATDAAWILCTAPPDVLLARARRRAGVPEHGSDAGERVVRHHLALTAGGTALPLPREPAAVLDTTRPDPLAALAAALDPPPQPS